MKWRKTGKRLWGRGNRKQEVVEKKKKEGMVKKNEKDMAEKRRNRKKR